MAIIDKVNMSIHINLWIFCLLFNNSKPLMKLCLYPHDTYLTYSISELSKYPNEYSTFVKNFVVNNVKQLSLNIEKIIHQIDDTKKAQKKSTT